MLPGIIPRLRAFASDGFSWLALLMASIYAAVGLLPPNHPYLNSFNKGRFGMRHVMVEAGRRLKFDRHHIDQVVIYVVLMTGFVVLLAQLALLAFGLVFGPALAGAGFTSLFVTEDPTNDVAFMLLDRVFAVPGLYESKFDTGMTPFSVGLHSLFSFYSQAMLIVGVFILLYYAVILVAETAQTGTPFGKRFDSVWAPIRLVVAIGLLVPVSYGYNSAQYIVLFAAKYGSSFASNSWNIYNETVSSATMGCTEGGANNAVGWCDESLVAVPRSPDVMNLIQFMTIARSCKTAYETIYKKEKQVAADGTETEGRLINPYLVRKTPAKQEFIEIIPGPSPDWQEALEFYNYGDILIVFGHESPSHKTALGTVQPYCGELLVPTADPKHVGAVAVQSAYYAIVIQMWEDAKIAEFARKANAMHIPQFKQEFEGPCENAISVGDTGTCDNGRSAGFPSAEFGQELKTTYFATVNAAMQAGRTAMIDNIDFSVTAEMSARGWAGAGIWYNQIAEWNGSFFSAVMNIPAVKSMPSVMKEVEKQKSGTDQNMPAIERYDPYLAAKDRVSDIKLDPSDRPLAQMMADIFKYWRGKNPTEKTENKVSGNVFFDTLSAIFGLNGLFTIRENATTHPMAQLSGIGRSIVESAIRNLMTAMGFAALGGMVEILESHQGGAFHTISGMFVTLTTMGLSVGFILYYVLPFLPFMYFYFAVGSWIKSIFEAMVGVPLWALAHLRIDGHGLHGDTALNGYFLIFEIFIRPILTVFGLLASMAIFAAMVKTLNGIFPMVTANLTGFDTDGPKVAGKILGIEFKRAIIDEFFFTLIYTVIVYMIALSSFKMIDLVPNNILRWMGQGVHTFSEGNEQNMNQFISFAAFGGARMTQQAATAATAFARTGGNAFGLMVKMVSGDGKGPQAKGTPGDKSGRSLSSRNNDDNSKGLSSRNNDDNG